MSDCPINEFDLFDDDDMDVFDLELGDRDVTPEDPFLPFGTAIVTTDDAPDTQGA